MSTLLLEVKRRMVNLTSKIDYSQKGTLIKENINWLLESRSMRIKESEVKCEIKARKLHWWRMEFPFRHVGACMHVFIFPKYLRCLDEQRHASALPGKFTFASSGLWYETFFCLSSWQSVIILLWVVNAHTAAHALTTAIWRYRRNAPLLVTLAKIQWREAQWKKTI